MFDIRDTVLSVDEVLASVSHAGAGGIDIFVGTVRDFNDGRTVTKLEYEAYKTMGLLEMNRIADELTHEFKDVKLAAIHRVGSLVVGDIAVICAASAVHRGEAFTACRRLIDEIKARVPIWKREWGPDGPYWIHWADARCTSDHGHQGHHHVHTP
jgi:molybdopterin synthase catalytic subunit